MLGCDHCLTPSGPFRNKRMLPGVEPVNAIVTVKCVTVHCHSLGIFLLEIQAKIILPLTIKLTIHSVTPEYNPCF